MQGEPLRFGSFYFLRYQLLQLRVTILTLVGVKDWATLQVHLVVRFQRVVQRFIEHVPLDDLI